MWKLTKVEDRVFNGTHPNDINVGSEVVGSFLGEPQEGYSFCFYNVTGDGMRATSKVVEVIDEEGENKKIVTKNSIYKLEKI